MTFFLVIFSGNGTIKMPIFFLTKWVKWEEKRVLESNIAVFAQKMALYLYGVFFTGSNIFITKRHIIDEYLII